MQSIQFYNAVEELKEILELDSTASMAEVVVKATLEDIVETDICQYMPEFASRGFFHYHGFEITLQDILTIISSDNHHILDNSGNSKGPYQTLIWWLRELKKNNIIFINDNTMQQDGSHPFDLATKIGDIQIMKIIARYCPIKNEEYEQGTLAQGFKPRFGNPTHNLLAYWLSFGHQFFSWFIRKGYTVNDTNSNGRPIIIIAADKNCSDIDELIYEGANIEIIDPRTGQTALHLYALNGTYRDILKDLITPNTINHRDNLGQTPLFYALNNVHTWARYVSNQEDRMSYRFCKILIDNGAEKDIMNKNGNNPIDVFNAMEHKYDILASLLGIPLEKIYVDTEDTIYDNDGSLRTGITEEREAKYLELLGESAESEQSNDSDVRFKNKIIEVITMKTPEGDDVISKELCDWLSDVFCIHLSVDLYESIQITGLIQGGISFLWRVEGFGDIGFTAFNNAQDGHYVIGNYHADCDISDSTNVIHILNKIHTAIEEATV